MSCSTGGCGTHSDMGFDPNDSKALEIQEKALQGVSTQISY